MILQQIISFVVFFILVFSILIVGRGITEIIITFKHKAGKIDLGKRGLLYLGLAFSYIITMIILAI